MLPIKSADGGGFGQTGKTFDAFALGRFRFRDERGHEEDRRPLQFFVSGETERHVGAIEFRHVQIEHDQVRREVPRGLHGLAAAILFLHDVGTCFLQQRPPHGGGRFLIVNDHDPLFSRG